MADQPILIPGDNGLPKTKLPIDVSSGDAATDAGQPIRLNTAGKVDITLLPIGDETRVAEAADDLQVGDYVYFFKDGALANSPIKVRLAVATSINTRAMGYVDQVTNVGQNATVYLEGRNINDNGYRTLSFPTTVYLSTDSPGKSTDTIPTDTTGNIVQIIGNYTGEGVTFEPNVSWIYG